LTIFSKNVLFLRNRGMKKAKLITGNVLRRNYIRGALEIDPEYSKYSKTKYIYISQRRRLEYF
jgi:hypothetical protein